MIEVQSLLPSSTKIVSAGPSSSSMRASQRRSRIGRTASSLKTGMTMLNRIPLADGIVMTLLGAARPWMIELINTKLTPCCAGDRLLADEQQQVGAARPKPEPGVGDRGVRRRER